MTDTPKRDDGHAVLLCAKCSRDVSDDWLFCPYCGDRNRKTEWREGAAQEEVARRLAKHIALKKARSEHHAADVVQIHADADWPHWLPIAREYIEVALFSHIAALTESSGKGTDGAEAMREAAAKIADERMVCGCGRADCYSDRIPESIAQAIRALPLPVSADGRDAVIEECAAVCDVKARASSQSVGTFSADGHRRRAEGQASGAKNCAAAIRRLKSNTGAGK